MFVVTGIAGKVGASVARCLHSAHQPVRAVVGDRSTDRNRISTLLKAGHVAAASLVFGLASAGAQASPSVDHSQEYKAMSMKDDLAHRSPDIHWPAGFEPEKADLFAHNDLIINASCERVWTHVIEATRWPTWYPNSKDVEIQRGDPVLRDGTVFRWTTFGLTIESKVHEYVVNQRLGWYGYAPGAEPSFYHSWFLEPRGAMCHVVMDEAGVGNDAAGLRKSDETLMHRGHDLWLASLKWVAEAKIPHLIRPLAEPLPRGPK